MQILTQSAWDTLETMSNKPMKCWSCGATLFSSQVLDVSASWDREEDTGGRGNGARTHTHTFPGRISVAETDILRRKAGDEV